MLRKATADDLPALTALRCGAAKANPVDAAGWLQNVAGLENILVLEKNGQPAAMLAAENGANVHYTQEGGGTALSWALHYGRTEVAEYLRSKGAR